MKSKKLIFNIAMVAVIITLVVCGFLFVNNIKNGKGSGKVNQDEIFGTITATKGNVRIERNGIGYTLKTDTIIIKGDKLSTLGKSTAELSLSEDTSVALDENTKLTAAEDGEVKEYRLNSGNIFVNAKASDPITISYGNGKLTPSDSVFSMNVHEDVPGVNVYSGTVSMTSGENEKISIKEGSCAFTGSGGAIETTAFTANSMNEFNIKQAQKISDIQLCFTTAEMEGVLSKRSETLEKAFREKELRLQELKALGTAETIIVIDEAKPEASKEETQKAPQASEKSEKKDDTSEIKIDSGIGTGIEIVSDTNNEESDRSNSGDTSIDVPKGTKTMTATIAISCYTLLGNMDKLRPGKDIYVPEDGSILDAVTVEFKEGETVLDILKRVCNANGIQLECSWFPIYNSYYIEGINHLYEFDGGDGSGWMYEVNGWKPNYGVSAYKVEDGDYISFDYTCDMGNDLGNPMS